MKLRDGWPLVLLLIATACSEGYNGKHVQSVVIEMEQVARLPGPVSNNAVSAFDFNDTRGLVSFLGLGGGKTWQDIGTSAVLIEILESGDGSSVITLPPVPVEHGLLAGVAVATSTHVYEFGGYSVAADGSEVSSPQVWQWSAAGYRSRAPMPVPVDDAVALVYQDRYLYLVSGWHDHGNVNLVQVYDSHSDRWSQATPYPGQPVFGHAGGMVGRLLVICDGVGIRYPEDGGARQFEAVSECWLGEVGPDDHRRIQWRPLPYHPGLSRYRMAATGTSVHGDRVLFAGGATNPYNFNGIGYNGEPAEPQAGLFSFDLSSRQWVCHGELRVATMDHRGLPQLGEDFYIVGGMLSGQQLSDVVWRFRLPAVAGDCQ